MFERSKIELPQCNLTLNEDTHTYKNELGLIIPSVHDVIFPVSNSVYGQFGSLSDAQTKGTLVHLGIELYEKLGVNTVPDEYSGYLEAYKKFVEDNEKKYRLVANEYKVYNKALNYCGTIDKILENVETGELVIVDYKTGAKKEYATLQLQLAGYKMALDTTIASLGLKIGDTRLLKLNRDKTYEFESIVAHTGDFVCCWSVYCYCKKYINGFGNKPNIKTETI